MDLQEIIVEDLKKHNGLSVDTIMKISSGISDIKEFKILAGMIKEQFTGLPVGYVATSLKNPQTPSNKRRRGDKGRTPPTDKQSDPYTSKRTLRLHPVNKSSNGPTATNNRLRLHKVNKSSNGPTATNNRSSRRRKK